MSQVNRASEAPGAVTQEQKMSIKTATEVATLRTALLHTTHVVLGPCPIEGYWVASERVHRELWAELSPLVVVKAVN